MVENGDWDDGNLHNKIYKNKMRFLFMSEESFGKLDLSL